VKKGNFSHKDETSYRVNGKLYWIWVYDSLDYVFYRMEDSRGMKVVNQDFGTECKQISINDCYDGYNRFKTNKFVGLI
jgi:transposase